MRIKCPDCSQKFDVTEEFLGKTVECGSCDSRFKVTNEQIVVEKEKFYPGEKKNKGLDNFGKAAASVQAPVAFEQAHYQPDVNASFVGPPRPRRTMAAIAGAAVLIMVIIVFLLAGGKEGSMRDMETANRFIFVGFAVLIGGGLYFYGMVHNRKSGLLVGGLLCAFVLALPVIFPANPTSATIVDNVDELEQRDDAEADKAEAERQYLFEIGYEPVQKAIAGGNPDTVAAVYLRNASKAVRAQIAAYLYSATDEASREVSYDRGTTGLNGLILMTEQKKSLDEIALLCKKFGRIEKISRDLRVIDVTVENSKVGTLDEDKMLDRENIDFERQNLKALSSIDPVEQMKAAKRLANSEPRALRPDITVQMVKMLPKSSNPLKIELIRALKVWSKPGDGSEQAVLAAVRELHKAGLAEKSGIDFLIEREVEGAEAILLELWKKDPVAWSATVSGLGEGAQVLLLPVLNSLDDVQVVAACGILGDSGTAACIPVLKETMAKSKSEVGKKSMQAAIDEIQNRS